MSNTFNLGIGENVTSINLLISKQEILKKECFYAYISSHYSKAIQS